VCSSDLETGNHVWAERFERAAADLIDVQDEITTAIVTRLEPELTRAEFELIRRRPPSDLGAWNYYVQASSVLSLKGWHERTFAEGAEFSARRSPSTPISRRPAPPCRCSWPSAT
jgi:hypothetical protein